MNRQPLKTFRRFAATARMALKQNSYFGFVDLLREYALRGITLLILLGIWHSLMSRGVAQPGFTRDQALAYTLLSTILFPLLNVRTQAASWMHDGEMLSLYLRPSGLFAQIMAHTLGGWVIHLSVFSLPVLALARALGLSVLPVTPWALPSLLLAAAQGFAMDFLFLCVSIRLRNMEWTMHSIRESLNTLLTGALIPFAALPWGIGDWLSLSPFGTLAGAPLAVWVGLDSAARLLPAQALWTALWWPLALFAFARSTERMVSYGG